MTLFVAMVVDLLCWLELCWLECVLCSCDLFAEFAYSTHSYYQTDRIQLVDETGNGSLVWEATRSDW